MLAPWKTATASGPRASRTRLRRSSNTRQSYPAFPGRSRRSEGAGIHARIYFAAAPLLGPASWLVNFPRIAGQSSRATPFSRSWLRIGLRPKLLRNIAADDAHIRAVGCANSIAFGDRAVVEAVVGELGKPGRANLAWRIDDVDPAAPTRNDRPPVRGQLDVLDEIQSRGERAIQEDSLPPSGPSPGAPICNHRLRPSTSAR